MISQETHSGTIMFNTEQPELDICSPRAMVADRFGTVRNETARLLGDPGVRACFHAGNGRDATELLKRKTPGIVILNKEFPPMMQRIPSAVVMMTSQAESEMIVSAMRPGADEYILKNAREGRVLPASTWPSARNFPHDSYRP